MKKLLIVFPIMFAFACVKCGESVPEPTPLPPDIHMCKVACDHIGPPTTENPDALNCPDGQPIDMLPDGGGCEFGVDEVNCVSCEKFCKDTMNQRVWLEPTCVSQIVSCDQIESCAPVGDVD